MDDIELVIKIPEDEYRWIKKSDKTVFADVASKECMLHAIKNGTPLPKGYGRLGDLDALAHKMCMAEIDNLESEEVAGLMLWLCDKAPTIIEADKEESEE